MKEEIDSKLATVGMKQAAAANIQEVVTLLNKQIEVAESLGLSVNISGHDYLDTLNSAANRRHVKARIWEETGY